jgi:hypothetical protein
VKRDRDHPVCFSLENSFSCVTVGVGTPSPVPLSHWTYINTPPLPLVPTASINRHIDSLTTQYPIEKPKVAHRLYQNNMPCPSSGRKLTYPYFHREPLKSGHHGNQPIPSKPQGHTKQPNNLPSANPQRNTKRIPTPIKPKNQLTISQTALPHLRLPPPRRLRVLPPLQDFPQCDHQLQTEKDGAAR